MRILMVNWARLADGAASGGGANGYCQGLARELAARGHDVSYLSAGVTYTPSARGGGAGPCEVRRLDDFGRIRVYEIVNSPVLAPGVFQFRNPLGEVANPALEAEVARLVSLISPHVVHFHNIEGFSSGCIGAIRSAVPTAKIVFSLHNYHTVCPQVYLMQGGRRPCTNFENGWACASCFDAPEPQEELRKRLFPGGSPPVVSLPQRTAPGRSVRTRDDCERAGAGEPIAPVVRDRASVETATLTNDIAPEPPCELPPNNYAHRRSAMVEMLSGCDRVLAVSGFVQRKFEALGVNPSRMRTMTIGSRFGDAAAPDLMDRSDLAGGRRPLRLVFMGYHNFYKGLHVLVEAMDSLDDATLARIELHVYAKELSPIRARLERLGLRLAGLKMLDGYAPGDVPALLAGKDVGVVPSVWWDNGPQTVMEFMACGLPVIGAAVGGIPEWVRGGENGCLFPANARAALAEIIRTIAQDPAAAVRVAAGVRPPKGMREHAAELEAEYASLVGAEAAAVPSAPAAAVRPRRRAITAIIPTWNRPEVALEAVRAVQQQVVSDATIEIVLIDNGSDAASASRLEEALRPNAVVLNGASVGEMPRLSGGPGLESLGALAEFEPRAAPRLVLTKNRMNLGGTGGFLAGLAWAQDRIAWAAARPGGDPCERFVWLVDDDAVPEVDACDKMLRAMELAPDVGLVGARSVHPQHPGTTLETTVYFNPETGHLQDHPPPGHRLFRAHADWVAAVGGTRGEHAYSGAIETDIAAACCLLVKAEVLDRVGVWDPRYFIYEDDADWCLRAGLQGFRVLMCLDAVVRHRTWHAKRSFQNLSFWLYQASRNRLWTMEKILDEPRRSELIGRWRRRLLWDALVAGVSRRKTHAHALLGAVRDSLANIGGKCPVSIPASEPTQAALRRIGAFRPGRTIVMICDRPEFLIAARGLREALRAGLAPGEACRFVECVRNDLPMTPVEPGVERIVYSSRARSKVRRQLCLLFRRVVAVVVFDVAGDLPLLPGSFNVHVESSAPDVAAVETDGVAGRIGFLASWVAVRCRLWIRELLA